MTQLDLVHESLNDALAGLISALGGAKRVGPQLRPELPVEQAAGWLRDCLNPTRREHLTPEQVLMLLRLGRQANVHIAATYILRDTGYADPVPLEPEDERAALQRMFNESVKTQAEILRRMERLAGPALRGVA